MNEVEKIFRRLVEEVVREDPKRLRKPLQLSEVYQAIIPYRKFKTVLGFDTNQDYEMALLRLFTGESGYVTLEPTEAQLALQAEVESKNPSPGAFRDYAAASVYLNPDAVRQVSDEDLSFARPQMTPEESAPAREERGEEDSQPPSPPEEEPERASGSPPEAHVEQQPPPQPPPPPDPERDRPAGPGAVFEPVPSPDQAQPEADACIRCGKPLPQNRDVVYCPFCGTNQHGSSCPSCGDELDEGWTFCVSCGAQVD